MKNNNGRLIFIVVFLLIIWLISGIFANIFSMSSTQSISSYHNVVLLKVDGFISTQDDYESVSSTNLVQDLKYYDSLDNIQAIIIEINSPGGSPVASKEIVDQIKRMTNKTVISYIRDLGASGAYWIASATDRIFANELSIVGSIGVTSSFLEFSGLLDKYNVTYNRIIAGKYKDIGSPFKEMTAEEAELLQKQINLIYEIFMRDVAKNRNMTYEEIKNYSDGKIFLGIEAKRNGLIDAYGGRDQAVEYVKDLINQEVVLFEKQKSQNIMSFMNNFLFSNLNNNELLVKI